jgi:hypothetical protein
MKTLLLDLTEVTITAFYALFLDKYKSRWEPHGTWIEVAVGTLVCLLFTWLRLQPVTTRREAIRQTTRSFVVGGWPIIIWRLYRSLTMILSAYRQDRRG